MVFCVLFFSETYCAAGGDEFEIPFWRLHRVFSYLRLSGMIQTQTVIWSGVANSQTCQIWPCVCLSSFGLCFLSLSLEQNTVCRLAYFKHRSGLINYNFRGFCLDPDSQYNFERMIWGRSCSALFISPVTLTSLGLFLLMSSAGSLVQEHIPRNSAGVMGARWLPLSCLTFVYGDGGWAPDEISSAWR